MMSTEIFRERKLDRGNLYDPKRLHHYRPPLRSDSRSLFQRVSQLSINDCKDDETSERSAETANKKNLAWRQANECSDTGSSVRSCTRSAQKHFRTQEWQKSQNWRLLKYAKVSSDSELNNQISSTLTSVPSSLESFSPLESNASSAQQTCHNNGVNTSKNWRISRQVSGSTNEDHIERPSIIQIPLPRGSGKFYSVRNHTSHQAHRQFKTNEENTSINCRLVKHVQESSNVKSLSVISTTLPQSSNEKDIPISEVVRNGIDGPQIKWQFKDKYKRNSYNNHCEEENLSLNESSVSATQDEVTCLTPDDPAPAPILLLPVPEHLRRYTPRSEIDSVSSPEFTPAESSSGVSSASQLSGETPSSRCTSSASLRSEEFFSDFSQHMPILFLPVPEHLRRYTPRSEMDGASSPEFTPAESSSGVSSASQLSGESLPSSRCTSSASLRSEEFFSGSTERSSSSCSTAPELKGAWDDCALSSNKQSKVPEMASPVVENSKTTADMSKSSLLEENSSLDMAAMGLPTSFRKPTAVKRKASYTSRKDEDIDEAVQTCFSKQFAFQPSAWQLPGAGLMFTSEPWELERFLILKQKLNDVKDELNDMPLNDWHAHTKRRNKAGNIIWQVRKRINPEFPTQAWCKFYENASNFPLIPQEAISSKSLNSVHLCEAPGAFITSLNHYLLTKLGKDFKLDWRAVTLNPYYEGNPLSCMINDDRLILHTLDKWLFGQDNTGDLMSYENLMSIIEEASSMGKILLVTADGSIDCQDDPSEQEEIVSWLHFCETVAALHLLAPGGSFLVKMFTLYEHFSICLMYLLNCVFKTVTVNKPVTSKEGNSEVYVVCCEYIGATEIRPWLDILMKNYGPKAPGRALFPLENIPSSFLDQLYSCADFYRRLQSDVIKENIRSFHNPVKRDSYAPPCTRHKVATQFFERYQIEKLDRSFYLVDKEQLVSSATPNIDPRCEEGSFNDRRNRRKLTPVEELQYLKEDLQYLNVKWPGDFDVFWMDFPENPKGFKITMGKAITKVNSSKFCLGSLLKLRNRVRDIAKNHFKVQVLQETSQSDTREFPWPDTESEEISNRKVITLDFKNKLWASLEDGSNAVNEKNICREILAAIEHKIFRDDCLELKGYPLLTQFNVGLVYLLGHLFEQVGFVRPKEQDIRVLFYKYRKFNPAMKRHWDDVSSSMDNESEAVLSVVKISEISDGDFYKYVTQINNLCVLEQIQDLLQAMSTS